MIITKEQLENTEEGRLDIDFLEIIPETNPDKPVEAALVASINENFIEVSGKIQAEVNLECDRCLKKFNLLITPDIKEVFALQNIFDYSHNEIELKNDNFVVELNNEGEIDITDLVYQSVILNLPSQKLCSQECDGNGLLDIHQEEKIDSRLTIFKDISRKLNKKEGK